MAESISNVVDMTLVPEDGLCIINGEQCSDNELFNKSDFPFHALQFHNNVLILEPSMAEDNIVLEGTDGYNYQNYIPTALERFNEKKQQEEAERLAQEAEYQAFHNSDEQRAVRVRQERDKRLDDTQWLVSRHQEQLSNDIPTTLTDEEYEQLLQYRQDLRDLTLQEGFPWQGGDNAEIPWPTMPIFVLNALNL